MTRSWSKLCWKLGLASFLTISGAAAFFGDCAFAQIRPDSTLGAERSVVTPNVVINGLPSDQIDGGAIRGVNLFHSFQDFSVVEGRGAYFTNTAGIENILGRVTGGSPSNILGKLGVLGGANLFLINPNGIIFGPKASLDVGGSFVATTANAIEFGNQGFFSASAPDVLPVLTVNPSALLFNQIAAGSITNNSREPAGRRLAPLDPSGVKFLFGLRVPDDRSLLLVGGLVSLEGGGLNALGGRVELAGVAGTGTVGLNINDNSLLLSYPAGVQRADVSLTNGARVDASGEGGGNIQLSGRRITFTDSSQIVANTLGSKPGETLTVTASDSVELIGPSPAGGTLTTETVGGSDAADLTINTGKLILRDGAQIRTTTRSEGSGGQLTVNASESVELTGRSGRTNSGLFSTTFAAGNAGDVTIDTRRLIVRDGAVISSESAAILGSLGQLIPATGAGGNLAVTAPDSVEIISGFVFTDTLGSKDAGDVTINTGKLLVQDEGQVSASTFGEGQGGTLTVNASDEVVLSGRNSSLFNATFAAGDAGDLKISTTQLIVQNGAEVTVSSTGTGDAGDIKLTARFIGLDNEGKLTATTESGKGGGNISLQELDLLLLRGNSEISTNAGGNGNGGNINIDADLLVALENSDITATAVRGRGGNIQINTQGIFGAETRSERTPESDITASSQLGIDGLVEINRPDVEPSSGLVALPAQLVDVSNLIAQGCPAEVGPTGSSFVVTGRGGLPPTPREALASEPALADLGTPIQGQENRASAAPSTNPTSSPPPTQIVEAQGWVINNKGEVVLTANVPTATPHIPWMTQASCHAPETSS